MKNVLPQFSLQPCIEIALGLWIWEVDGSSWSTVVPLLFHDRII